MAQWGFSASKITALVGMVLGAWAIAMGHFGPIYIGIMGGEAAAATL